MVQAARAAKSHLVLVEHRHLAAIKAALGGPTAENSAAPPPAAFSSSGNRAVLALMAGAGGNLGMPVNFFPNLGESHRSRIRITLTLLDEALVNFEAWAQGREVRSLLYREENNLDPAQRSGLLADIAGIRRLIQELRDDLHLEASSRDIAKTIRGHCYLLWVDVLELTGKYLRGFGEPSPELLDYLEPRVYRLLQYLDHIKALLTKPGS
jgi:hypothetical protein